MSEPTPDWVERHDGLLTLDCAPIFLAADPVQCADGRLRWAWAALVVSPMGEQRHGWGASESLDEAKAAAHGAGVHLAIRMLAHLAVDVARGLVVAEVPDAGA